MLCLLSLESLRLQNSLNFSHSSLAEVRRCFRRESAASALLWEGELAGTGGGWLLWSDRSCLLIEGDKESILFSQSSPHSSEQCQSPFLISSYVNQIFLSFFRNNWVRKSFFFFFNHEEDYWATSVHRVTNKMKRTSLQPMHLKGVINPVAIFQEERTCITVYSKTRIAFSDMFYTYLGDLSFTDYEYL